MSLALTAAANAEERYDDDGNLIESVPQESYSDEGGFKLTPEADPNYVPPKETVPTQGQTGGSSSSGETQSDKEPDKQTPQTGDNTSDWEKENSNEQYLTPQSDRMVKEVVVPERTVKSTKEVKNTITNDYNKILSTWGTEAFTSAVLPNIKHSKNPNEAIRGGEGSAVSRFGVSSVAKEHFFVRSNFRSTRTLVGNFELDSTKASNIMIYGDLSKSSGRFAIAQHQVEWFRYFTEALFEPTNNLYHGTWTKTEDGDFLLDLKGLHSVYGSGDLDSKEITYAVPYVSLYPDEKYNKARSNNTTMVVSKDLMYYPDLFIPTSLVTKDNTYKLGLVQVIATEFNDTINMPLGIDGHVSGAPNVAEPVLDNIVPPADLTSSEKALYIEQETQKRIESYNNKVRAAKKTFPTSTNRVIIHGTSMHFRNKAEEFINPHGDILTVVPIAGGLPGFANSIWSPDKGIRSTAAYSIIDNKLVFNKKYMKTIGNNGLTLMVISKNGQSEQIFITGAGGRYGVNYKRNVSSENLNESDSNTQAGISIMHSNKEELGYRRVYRDDYKDYNTYKSHRDSNLQRIMKNYTTTPYSPARVSYLMEDVYEMDQYGVRHPTHGLEYRMDTVQFSPSLSTDVYVESFNVIRNNMIEITHTYNLGNINADPPYVSTMPKSSKDLPPIEIPKKLTDQTTFELTIKPLEVDDKGVVLPRKDTAEYDLNYESILKVESVGTYIFEDEFTWNIKGKVLTIKSPMFIEFGRANHKFKVTYLRTDGKEATQTVTVKVGFDNPEPRPIDNWSTSINVFSLAERSEYHNDLELISSHPEVTVSKVLINDVDVPADYYRIVGGVVIISKDYLKTLPAGDSAHIQVTYNEGLDLTLYFPIIKDEPVFEQPAVIECEVKPSV